MSDAGVKYHVELEDAASGETLGLMLTEDGGVLGRSAQLVNPYAAKVGSGDLQLSDLTDMSVYFQTDWRGGRGQEVWDEEDSFYDSQGVETRIDGQVTLGPLVQSSDIEEADTTTEPPVYEPTTQTPVVVGYPGVLRQEVASNQIGTTSTTWHAQRIKVPAGFQIESVAVEVYKWGSPTAALTLSLYSDVAGKPGSSLTSKSLAAASIATTATWTTFTFSSAYSNTADYLHIVLSTTETSGQYFWRMQRTGNVYEDGLAHTSIDSGTAWAWVENRDFTFRVAFVKKAQERSITAPAGGISCTGATLRLRKTGTLTQTYVLSLYADSGGSPTGSALKTANITDADVETGWTNHYEAWASAQALTAATAYHLTLDPPASADEPGVYLEWAGDGTASDTTGATKYKNGSGSWTADTTTDLWFRVNKGLAGAGDIVTDFVRFDDGWYCAGGDVVYKYDSTTPIWARGDAQADEDVTDMIAWDAYLWVARGANNARYADTDDSWSDVTGPKDMLHLCQYGGYLFYSDNSAPDTMYYTGDGSTWSSAVEVGPGDWGINAMAGFRGDLMIANDVGLWRNILEYSDQLLDWTSVESGDNGRQMMVWSKVNDLFIPVGYGLYRWNFTTMVSMGPDLGAGLPAARQGKVASLVGTVNSLFAAIDGGASNTSSILAYNGMGWHEIVRAEIAGDRIRGMGYETLSSPPRLWWGEADKIRFVELPDYSDNPAGFSGYKFASTGELTQSWWGSEMLKVIKDYRAVVVHSEDTASGQTIRVYYEVDRSGLWTLLGEINDAQAIHVLQFPVTAFDYKTTTTGCTKTTINLASGSTTTNIKAGDWVRINEEIRQISSITDNDTFVLTQALSVEPDSGDLVYGARAAGVEIRLKFELSTTSEGSSPKLLSNALYCQANVMDRWTVNLTVSVRDEQLCLDDSIYPYNAKELMTELERWVTRETAFTLHDMYGVDRTVKVANATQSPPRLVVTGPNQSTAKYACTMRLALTEVNIE